MNGGQSGKYRFYRYIVDLDMTSVLKKTLDLIQKKEEKEALELLICKLSMDQVKFADVLSKAFPELAKQMPRFLQKRIEDHRASLRVAKIFSFQSSSDIEQKAVRLAIDDTKAVMKEISMLNNESISGLVDEHRGILSRLVDAMVKLAMESPGQINIDLDALKKFLEGEEK